MGIRTAALLGVVVSALLLCLLPGFAGATEAGVSFDLGIGFHRFTDVDALRDGSSERFGLMIRVDDDLEIGILQDNVEFDVSEGEKTTQGNLDAKALRILKELGGGAAVGVDVGTAQVSIPAAANSSGRRIQESTAFGDLLGRVRLLSASERPVGAEFALEVGYRFIPIENANPLGPQDPGESAMIEDLNGLFIVLSVGVVF